VYQRFLGRRVSHLTSTVTGMYTPGPEVEQLRVAVTALLDRDPHVLPDVELVNSTELLMQLRHQLDAVLTRQLQVIDVRDATIEDCGRATRGWLVEELLLAPAEANRYVSVARGLPTHTAVADGLAQGRLTLEHARVITTAVQKAPAELRDVIEKELVTASEVCDPARLGSFTRELIARLTDEDAEAAAQRKYESRWVRISQTFDGMHAIDGMLDPASAATLQAALTPLLSRSGPDDERTGAQRTADALVTIAQHALAAGGLPETGGEKPQVIVTISYDQLKAELDAYADRLTADLTGPVTINGTPITPATARMIACDAQIIPAVLGGNREVLDLGRKTPTWSPAQRRALRLEDQGCRWPRCQAALFRCRIHHQIFWSRGGSTDKRDGIHLCELHHWVVHHTRWRIRKDHHNKVHIWRE